MPAWIPSVSYTHLDVYKRQVSNVTYAVIISIDNSDGRLGSGSSATVTFQGEQEEKTE